MANIIRYDPFHEMVSLREAMDRMMESAFVRPRFGWLRETAWDLALDVAEDDEQFVVKASIPGVNPDNIEITYDANVLTIKGEAKEESEVKERNYHLRERRYGSFSRSVSLPASVNPDKIEATYDKGVLTLHLPKVEEAKPRKIKVLGGEKPKVIEAKATDITGKN